MATARHYTFRDLTIRLRPGWRVQDQADPGQAVRITTGAPCRDSQFGVTDCPGFLLLGPAPIREAYELQPYDPERPWHPGTGVEGCPMDRDGLAEGMPSRPKIAGFAQVGGHTAVYREWLVPCRAAQGGTALPGNRVAATYVQRLWHLPRSQILIVDEWSVPELPETLARATWRR